MPNEEPENLQSSTSEIEPTKQSDLTSADLDLGLAEMIAQVVNFSSSFSGPLPSPEILKAYDLVLPGLAERIVTQAENQSQHRMALEKTIIEGDSKRADRGQILGFILALTLIFSGVFLIRDDHDWAGTAIIGTGAASLVGTFVYGSNQRSNERLEKEQLLLNKKSTKD